MAIAKYVGRFAMVLPSNTNNAGVRVGHSHPTAQHRGRLDHVIAVAIREKVTVFAIKINISVIVKKQK